MTEVPKRLWLPLFMLETVGSTIHSKTKFQKLTFIVQYLAKIDEYDFRKHHYGPYSDTLDIDTTCYPELIEHTVKDSTHSYDRQYHVYSITKGGQSLLSQLKKEINPETVEKTKEFIKKYQNKNRCELLEEVYSKFAIKPQDSVQFMKEVSEELSHVMPPVTQCYTTYHNRQSTFVLSVLELVEMVLISLKSVEDTARRGVVLNLSKELIQKCNDVAKYLLPPANSEFLRPQFIEMAELESFLREYCETRNIMKDPLKQPLDEVITENEAERLSRALSDLQITIQ